MKTKKLLAFILSLIITLPLSVFTGTALTGKEYFVSPDGDDSNPGTLSSPFATLEKAKEEAKIDGNNVTVYFRAGTYTFKDTVYFDGTDCENITFSAYGNEKVVFTSGLPIKNFKECTVNGVKAFYAYTSKSADFNVLFSEETTLKRTRYPEEGYLYVKSVSDKDVMFNSTEAVHCGYGAFYADKKDIPVFKNEQDVIVRILHFWKDELLTVKSYDAGSGHLSFNRSTSMQVKENDRYFFENVFESLNSPGEWYLDKAECKVYYIPQKGESAEDLTLWASETETMFNINGCNGVSFRGITFRGNGFNLPGENTRDSSQAAYNATPCVKYENCNNFVLENCDFKDIASCAVFFGVNVQDAGVKSCYFENLGAQAFYVRGENLPADGKNVTKNIDFINNCINGYGRFLYNAVGVLIIHANTVNIENNEIHDGYYSAVSVGWVWGYGYTVTYNNRICNNLIYNIGQGWLSDMGGIYTLGNQPGTVISGNIIHNVAADPGQGGYGGWGIYLDEGSAYIDVFDNLVFACGNDGYHLHYGSLNTVHNNIFALNGESQIRVVSAPKRCTPEKTADFTGNIILTDKKVRALSHMENTACFNENGNIYWDLTYGDEIYFGKVADANKALGLKRAEKSGFIHNPVTLNPMFKDAGSFDFEFKDESPVKDYGFKLWDYSSAGTLENTVVGTWYNGGQTAYNYQAHYENMTSSKEPFHKLIEFFYKIIEFFSKLFK